MRFSDDFIIMLPSVKANSMADWFCYNINYEARFVHEKAKSAKNTGQSLTARSRLED